MEKLLKIFLRLLIFVLIVILIIIGVVFAKNALIFGTIRMKGRKILKSDNYKISIVSSMPDYDYSVKKEIYFKDDAQAIYTYNHDELNEVCWKDYSTDETLSYVTTEKGNYNIEFRNEIIEEVEDLMRLRKFSLFKNCILNIVETRDNCYVFKPGKNYEIYYDQFTGELIKTVIYNDDLKTVNLVNEYQFELDKVVDENVKKPIV